MRSCQVTIDDTPVPDSDRDAGSIKVKPAESTDYVLTAQSATGQVQKGVVVPVKVIGEQDGMWNKLAWKTEAFYGNPLTGFTALP